MGHDPRKISWKQRIFFVPHSSFRKDPDPSFGVLSEISRRVPGSVPSPHSPQGHDADHETGGLRLPPIKAIEEGRIGHARGEFLRCNFPT
jgi:hypothetical protein